MVRTVVGLVGFVLLVAGARVYRIGLLLTAFGAGVIGVLAAIRAVAPYAVVPPATAGAVAIAVGVAGAVIVSFVHRWGLVALGGWLGALGASVVAGWAAAESPWWAGLVGGALGAVAMPFVFRLLLRVVTPVVGALLLLWSVQALDHPWWFAPLTVLGIAIQTGLVRGPGPADDEDT